MEDVLTDLTAGNAAGNRGGANILEPCSSFWLPAVLVRSFLPGPPHPDGFTHVLALRFALPQDLCGVHGADCRGSGKLASATLRRHSVSAVAARTTGPTSLRLSRVRLRGKLGVLLNGLEFEPGFGAVTGTGPEDRRARGLSGRLEHVEVFPFVSRHGVRSSYWRGAENNSLFSCWDCALVSEWPRASHSSSHVGGMSGHSLCSPVVLGLACWWLSLVWVGTGASGGCAPGAGAFR